MASDARRPLTQQDLEAIIQDFSNFESDDNSDISNNTNLDQRPSISGGGAPFANEKMTEHQESCAKSARRSYV
ncbi:unnamed protein product [Acanthoscelides obtectus]|nr:unnamed protein product [Acanthoscelides obtectus]CAK1640905.1 hypothetical protein AOBTE_LOCUS12012 [Acanthoscelides obtectus]